MHPYVSPVKFPKDDDNHGIEAKNGKNLNLGCVRLSSGSFVDDYYSSDSSRKYHRF